jgi:SRSO17 transposase
MVARRYSEFTATQNVPEIAKLNGLKDGQSLHHFLRDSPWDVVQVRAIRLHLIRQQIGLQPISLCIDETGDVKKGQTTDYVAKQYIGNLGKTEDGMVSVNAYAVAENITYPWRCCINGGSRKGKRW